LCPYGPALASGDFALDRGALSEARRLVTLKRLLGALQSCRPVPERAGGRVALVGTTFASIRCVLAPIGDLVPHVGDPLPLVGDPFPIIRRPVTLARRPHAAEAGRSRLVKEPTLPAQPGALPLQGPVIRAELRGPEPDLRSQACDLGTAGRVRLLSPPGTRPLHIRAVRVELRGLTLKPDTTPLKLSPLRFTAGIQLQSGGFVAGRTFLVHALRPVKLALADPWLPGGKFHRRRISRFAEYIKPASGRPPLDAVPA
jgi:hypothetical protein